MRLVGTSRTPSPVAIACCVSAEKSPRSAVSPFPSRGLRVDTGYSPPAAAAGAASASGFRFTRLAITSLASER